MTRSDLEWDEVIDGIPVTCGGLFQRQLFEIMDDYDCGDSDDLQKECHCGRVMYFSEDPKDKMFGVANERYSDRNDSIKWFEQHYMMKFDEWEIL